MVLYEWNTNGKHCSYVVCDCVVLTILCLKMLNQHMIVVVQVALFAKDKIANTCNYHMKVNKQFTATQ